MRSMRRATAELRGRSQRKGSAPAGPEAIAIHRPSGDGTAWAAAGAGTSVLPSGSARVKRAGTAAGDTGAAGDDHGDCDGDGGDGPGQPRAPGWGGKDGRDRFGLVQDKAGVADGKEAELGVLVETEGDEAAGRSAGGAE